MAPIASLSGIATFCVVARASCFIEAGELLGISKSAVGKSVARLEQRLGVKLFHRTMRRLSLTTAGEAYFPVCQQALEEIGEAENNLGSRLGEPAGRLHVERPMCACMPTAAAPASRRRSCITGSPRWLSMPVSSGQQYLD